MRMNVTEKTDVYGESYTTMTGETFEARLRPGGQHGKGYLHVRTQDGWPPRLDVRLRDSALPLLAEVRSGRMRVTLWPDHLTLTGPRTQNAHPSVKVGFGRLRVTRTGVTVKLPSLSVALRSNGRDGRGVLDA